MLEDSRRRTEEAMTEDASLDALNASYGAIPVHTRMGLRIKQAGPHAILEIELNDEVRGHSPGTIHGGMLATLADVAAVTTLQGAYDAETHVAATTDMHIRYYRQPKSGPITAEGRLVYKGQRILSAECSILDGERRELARATATYMIVPRPVRRSEWMGQTK
jgi:uncharacterized protein (TIGR00369 family)